MSEPSAESKRVDQQRMSLDEYKVLDGIERFEKFIAKSEETVLFAFSLDYGDLALNRLEGQANVESISPYQKLMNLGDHAKLLRE